MSTLSSNSANKSGESIGSYSFVHDQQSCRGNSSISDLVPDEKWWLNHHGLETGYSLDQLSVIEADAKNLAAICVDGNAKAPAESKLMEDYYKSNPKNVAAFSSDIPLKHFCSHRKSNGDGWLLEFESTINDDLLPNAHLMGLDSCNCLFVEQPEKLCSDLDSHWMGVKKIEPWWHAVDIDDLASLVSQTSSHCIRNCDHPGVQCKYVEGSKKCVFCFDLLDKETKVSHVASVSSDKSLGKQGSMESIQKESDQTFSRDSFNNAKVGSSDAQEPSDDLSRDQLLEALCHSQTRAREAEKLAQKACDDKGHVINLFFQQASCLFAYRQWLRILQLETLCLHLSSQDQLVSFAPPSLSPWIPNKGMTLRKTRCSGAAKKKPNKQGCNVRECAFAFAIGLSLAGAGLLFGWTIGCLFPAF